MDIFVQDQKNDGGSFHFSPTGSQMTFPKDNAGKEFKFRLLYQVDFVPGLISVMVNGTVTVRGNLGIKIATERRNNQLHTVS
jgi:hypothetical protein